MKYLKLSQLALFLGFFFKVCPREISETVSDPETKLMDQTHLFRKKNQDLRDFSDFNGVIISLINVEDFYPFDE